MPSFPVPLLVVVIVLALLLYRFYPGRHRLASSSGSIQEDGWDRVTDEKPKSQRLEAKKRKQLAAFKDMYYKVQNLEDFPEALRPARAMLQSLLEQGLLMARYKAAAFDILDIKEFDPARLRKLMAAKHADVGREFEAYVQRRRAGGGPELFKTFEEACRFLKTSAPWNYVDGAWLARIHQVTTPFALRGVTKDAWQIFSEELGDGDLEKNHVVLYRDLLRSVGVELPDGDSADFVDARHGMEDESIWRYAVGQLLLSVFPNDFLPEILGFNLYYESPAIVGCKANKELPEFGISAYYYALHISIDNADSGHSAMALGNIVHFMRVVRETGLMSYESAWRRVQAGYCLGQSLDDKETVDDYEDRLVEFLHRKARVASKIHCTSRARIGKRSLSSWFSPSSSPSSAANLKEDDDDDSWKDDFLAALADSKPWIYRGDSSKSLLMREVSWKGRMFGAFTHDEVQLMRTWIDSLPPRKTKEDDSDPAEQQYWHLVGGFESVEKTFSPPRRDVAVTHPVFPPREEWWSSSSSSGGRFVPRAPLLVPPPSGAQGVVRLDALVPLWFAHAGLLENTISSPHRTIAPLVSLCLQLLRAEKGYKPEGSGIACMDEQLRPSYSPDLVDLGLDMVRRHRQGSEPEPTCLGDVLGPPPPPADDTTMSDAAAAVGFAYTLLGWAQRPGRNGAFLLGLARAFLDLEAWVAGCGDALLGPRQREALRLMVERKAVGFEKCLDVLKADEQKRREFVAGYERGRDEIERLLL